MRPDPPFVAIRPRTRALGHVVHHVAEATSTMDVAREKARKGAPEGLVVVADRQTAGVGRNARPWTTVGSSLHATVLLRPRNAGTNLALLPLATGVALVEAARRLLRVDLRLKWPNDVLHEGRKVGGILIESVFTGGPDPEFTLVGFGVNGDARPEDFPPDLRGRAASLSTAAGHHVCLPAYLKLALEALEPLYDGLQSENPALVWDPGRRLMETVGRRVRVTTPEEILEGDAVDLGPQGELLVRTPDGVRAVVAGDCEELRNL